MSQKTDTTIAAAPCCGSCVQMREEDGYCKHLGRYVNYFRIACKDYVDRIAVAERPGPDSSDAKEMKEEQGNRPLPSDILEEAAEKFAHLYDNGTCDGIAQDCFIAGAKWQMEQMMDEWLQDRDGCFWDGVAEGKKAMEEQMEVLQNAEKNLALKWEDMREIIRIDEEMIDDPEAHPEWMEEQPFYEEVLKRYKEAKK